ncbi:hypothetical protein [Pseudomonas graminis]|uniref:hypothetical protein n=1 Tax=Pseudomonas graminis TaxID=158627 RepID=UPI003C2355B2
MDANIAKQLEVSLDKVDSEPAEIFLDKDGDGNRIKLHYAYLTKNYLYGNNVRGETKPTDWVLRIDFNAGFNLTPGDHQIPVDRVSILLVEGGSFHYTSGGMGLDGTLHIDGINLETGTVDGYITDLVAGGSGRPDGTPMPPAHIKKITFKSPVSV